MTARRAAITIGVVGIGVAIALFQVYYRKTTAPRIASYVREPLSRPAIGPDSRRGARSAPAVPIVDGPRGTNCWDFRVVTDGGQPIAAAHLSDGKTPLL